MINSAFAAETWDRWCLEARATAIPGALEFTRDAEKRGVTVFYITNRAAKVEEATRRNLEALGFPLRASCWIRCSHEVNVRSGSHRRKAPRRAHVAATYRVLLLIGDDLGDFVADPAGTPEQRAARTAPQSAWWGRRWIMLPNPSYGSWERAIVGTATDPIAAKRQALKYEPAPIPDRNRGIPRNTDP